MEFRYRLQQLDFDTLRRHLHERNRTDTGGMALRMILWMTVGIVAWVNLDTLQELYSNSYHASLAIMTAIIFYVSIIWQRIWRQSKQGERWLKQFSGDYLLNLTSAGISIKSPYERINFYAWPEIQEFENTNTFYYLYLRRDAAIPVPRSAFTGSDADVFFENVLAYWAAHPENNGKTLSTERVPKYHKPGTALYTNLLHAVRILFFIDCDTAAFRVSFGMLFRLLLLDMLGIGLIDYIDALPDPNFNNYGLSYYGATILLTIGGVACISNLSMLRTQMLRLLTMIMSLQLVIHFFYFSSWLVAEYWWTYSSVVLWALYAAVTLWMLAAIFRILRRIYHQPAPSALRLVTVFALFSVVLKSMLPSERLYYPAYETEANDYSSAAQDASQFDVESLFYRQPEMVEHEISALAPQRPEKTDLYFVGFAGQAEEKVFFNEVSFAKDVLDSRFETAGRSLILVNNADTVNSAPLANKHNLATVLREIGRHMDRQQDVLFLFLSSHGAQDHKLSVSFWPLGLNDLKAEELKDMLDDAGIRNRIIVVSACYSGGFLDVLKDDNSLILTASSRDHVAYGCGDFTQYTYFGESYFVKALASGDSFISAFEQARRMIQEKEEIEGLDASNPQIAVGRNIVPILQNVDVSTADTRAHPQQTLHAADTAFSDRVRQARRFEQDVTAKDYAEKFLFPVVNTDLSASLIDCLDHPNANTEKFTLVADIMQNGEIENVAFQPSTNTAECFVKSFSALKLPPIPTKFSVLPVSFDMHITG